MAKNNNDGGGQDPTGNNQPNSDNQNPKGGKGGDGGEQSIPLSRFNEVNDELKKFKEADEKRKTEAKKAEEDNLAKNKEFETLATKREEEVKQVRAELVETKLQNAVERAAIKAGAADSETVYKLFDRTNVKVNEDGTISGVEEAVKALLEAKPFLKGSGSESSSTIGTGTNPADSESKKFALSWVRARWADVSWTRDKHEEYGGITGSDFLKKIENEGRIDPNS